MKICLLEPAILDPSIAKKIQQIRSCLNQLGYEICEEASDPSILKNIRKDQPDVVFNLSSIYTWGKANLIPAVLEVSGIRYTGSGILGLSLGRNAPRLYPLLFEAGLPLPDFMVCTGQTPPAHWAHYPVTLLRENMRGETCCLNARALRSFLSQLPADEKVVLVQQMTGEHSRVYLLDRAPLPLPATPQALAIAQKAFDLLEARGLVRFDFVQSTEGQSLFLERIDIAPDPLDENLLRAAAVTGWKKERLLQSLVSHSAKDLAQPA